jgi:hypothetical protein
MPADAPERNLRDMVGEAMRNEAMKCSDGVWSHLSERAREHYRKRADALGECLAAFGLSIVHQEEEK